MTMRGMAEIGPSVLEGPGVRLEPLTAEHRKGLLQAAAFPQIWQWMSSDLSDPQKLDAWINEAAASAVAGRSYAYAVRLTSTGQVVGSTRYLSINRLHRNLEIGWTWYTPAVWKTRVNPTAKWLLLRHAFEVWGAIRVQLRTDHLNLRSQAAIKKLGAVYEGRLRHHRVRPDGTLRDSMVFSIVAEEWPKVEAGLLARIGAWAPEG